MSLIGIYYTCPKCKDSFFDEPVAENIIEDRHLWCCKCNKTMNMSIKLREKELKKELTYIEGKRKALIFLDEYGKFKKCEINFSGIWNYDDWIFLEKIANEIKNKY